MAYEKYFHRTASYWKRVYEESDIVAIGYQERQSASLQWVSELPLPSSGRALDAGCGAGMLTAALANLGLTVTAVDSVHAMLDLTRATVESAGMSERVEVQQADVHQLPFASETFDLVIALGLVPWLPHPTLALAEMRRVLRPGGHLVISADNRYRLTYLLDPTRLWPCVWTWRALRKMLRLRVGKPAETHSTREFNLWLDAAGLEVVRRTTIGFGPFTFFRFPVLSQSMAVALSRKLQTFANRKWPLFDLGGNHYLVLATKTPILCELPMRAPATVEEPGSSLAA